MITYAVVKKGHEALDVLAGQIEANHPDLVEHDVTIGVDFAHVPEGESLKWRGVPCHAYAKITPYRQRVRGYPDGVITVDFAHWQEIPDERKAALMDHEAAHFLVAFDKDGNPKSDDLGRPKLTMRPHDWDFGWFKDVAERHGEASYEIQQAREFADSHGQLFFGWAAPAEGETLPIARRKRA